MRALAFLAAVLFLVACGGAARALPTPVTALEQRLSARGTVPSPVPTATPLAAPTMAPEPTAAFGRRVTPTPLRPAAPRPAEVSRVETGRRIFLKFDGREEPVTLLGVQPVEEVSVGHPVDCFWHDAAAFARHLLPIGSTVDVETDPAISRDRDGRVPVWIWLPDGRLVNQEMIRIGLGRALLEPPHRHQLAFRATEREARLEGYGVWSTLTCYDNPDTRGIPTLRWP